MNALHKAEAAAREALDTHRDNCDDECERPYAHIYWPDIVANLLAALDAARGEAVAWGMPLSNGDIIDCISPQEHTKYEGGYTLPLYAAPPAAADRVALARSWNAGYEAARAELAAPPAALAVPAASTVSGLALAAIGVKHFGNPIPAEWYAAARELLAQQPAAAVPEGYALVPVQSLRWWRELAEINPQDLVPRIDAMLAAAERKGVGND